MQRPTILNRLITLHARRISPTRPARLVGPSRLLRRDKVRSPHTNGPRDQSPECEVLVAIAVAITQSATSNPFQPPKQWAPGSSRIPVRRSCHDDYCVIQPDIPSSVHFPDVPCGSLAPLISTAFTSWLRGAKEESKGPKRLASSSVMRVTEKAQASGLKAKLALAGTRNLRSARCGSTKIRPPAGFDRCSAACRDRAARHYVPAAFQFHCETARYHTACL